MEPYDHSSIEPKWQAAWTEAQAFKAENAPSKDKAYVLDMFPYPSGSGLHVGHLLGYTGSDVIARYSRLRGKAVLHPMGWDAFGLPAENFAIKSGVHPAISTVKNIAEYKRQLTQAGMSYDWSREMATSDPAYYKWTQWFFQLLYKKGLAYRKEGLVNWCPKCQTVLANEQVVHGRCERCDTPVVQKMLKQWYFKITEYAERLLADLDELDWPEKIKTMQRNWIGKSEGARLFFALEGREDKLEVFTTRPDTLFGATYVVIAPEHPLAVELATPEQKPDIQAYLDQAAAETELERTFTDRQKTGVFTGAYAINPATQEKVPVWVADYVLGSYGTGAVMAVPAHDERDLEFALKFNLPIRQVIVEKIVQETEPAKYRPDQPVKEGESVIVFVKHPSEDKYLGLNWTESSWGAKTLVTGTIDEGFTAEETVIKEIKEETGYQNLGTPRKLGAVDGLFYHLPKQTNKLVRGHVFVVALENEDKVEVASDEAARHELMWLTAEELTGFLTPETHKVALEWLKRGSYGYFGHGSLIESGEFGGQQSLDAKKAVAEFAGGEMTTTYRLRDWLVSRQRFWGAPIPVAYDENGTEYLLPESELPVELPMDVEFLPTGRSPLADAETWKKYVDPETGKELVREADTLDTFVCSSWYYLRFPNPAYADGAFDPEAVKAWLPVDTYIGGAEHAVLHLLYARFFTKVLFDEGLVSFKEPFTRLRNQGIILGPDNNKMSKSKGNVINPDDVVKEYGADTLRMYELFMAPFEVEKPWSTQGIVGVRRFLDRFWKLQGKLADAATPEEEDVLHRLIHKATEAVEEYRFNVGVAAMMEALNALEALPSVAKATYKDFALLLNPFAPHLTEEIWKLLGEDGFCSLASWPAYDASKILAKDVEYPVQVNGKVRFKVAVPAETSDEDVIAAVKAHEKYLEYVPEEPKKVITVPGRLVSIVL